MDSWFWGTENHTEQQCDVLNKNQIAWLSHAFLKISPVAWALSSSVPSKETPEQHRESYYSGFVSLRVPCIGFHLVPEEIEEGHEEEIIMT